MNDEERRVSLTQYANKGARAQPPVFVGRNAVIQDIGNAATLAHQMWLSGDIDANDPGLTRLVQGAPGAGKTALLRHLQEKWGSGTPGPHNPICVNLNVDALGNVESLGRVIRQTLPESALEKWGGAIIRALATYLSGGDQAIGEDAEQATVAGSRRLLRQDRAAAFPAPIIVMVDEAQMVEPSTPPANALRSLHLGRVGDIPILPVFAGLGYLQSHLQREGINISRYSNEAKCIHVLERLSPAECRDLSDSWLRHFGVDAPDALGEPWSDALILDTQGWPMHTNGFLGALAEALAVSRNPASLEGVDIDAVRRVAAKTRDSYYGGRYQGVVLDHDQWVGRAMAAIDAASPVRPGDAIRIIGEAGPADERASKTLRDALIELGFLQLQSRGWHCDCPIPSLVRYAAVRAMQDPGLHTAATLGQVDDLRRLMAAGSDLEARDALGRTPLHIAAECQWVDLAQALVEAGADAGAPDIGGATPRGAWPAFAWPDKRLENNSDGDESGVSGGSFSAGVSKRTHRQAP